MSLSEPSDIRKKTDLKNVLLNSTLRYVINLSNPNLLQNNQEKKSGKIWAINLRTWIIKNILDLRIFNNRLKSETLSPEQRMKYFEVRNKIQQAILEVLGIKDQVRSQFVKEMVARLVLQSYKPEIKNFQKSGLSIVISPEIFIDQDVWEELLADFGHFQTYQKALDMVVKTKYNPSTIDKLEFKLNIYKQKIQKNILVFLHEYAHFSRQNAYYYDVDAYGGYIKTRNFDDYASKYQVDKNFRTLEEIYAVACQYKYLDFLVAVTPKFSNSHKSKAYFYSSIAYSFVQDKLDVIFGSDYTTRISKLQTALNKTCGFNPDHKDYIFKTDIIPFVYFSNCIQNTDNSEFIRLLQKLNYFMEGGTIESLELLNSPDSIPNTPCKILKGFGIDSFNQNGINFVNARDICITSMLEKVPEDKQTEVLNILNSLN